MSIDPAPAPGERTISISIRRSGTKKRLSKLVVHRGIAYRAAQVADDLDADLSVQTQETLARIDALFAEAGTDGSRILTAQIWFASMADAPRMNAIRETWMPEGAAPARATVGHRLRRPVTWSRSRSSLQSTDRRRRSPQPRASEAWTVPRRVRCPAMR